MFKFYNLNIWKLNILLKKIYKENTNLILKKKKDEDKIGESSFKEQRTKLLNQCEAQM